MEIKGRKVQKENLAKICNNNYNYNKNTILSANK